jgi:hypothetical protein
MPLCGARDLGETRVWRRLVAATAEDPLLSGLANAVKAACDTAAQRMKQMPQYAPQFTLHDERHLVRVVDLAGHVLGSTADQLNAPELALLILSAFYHDQGMVPERAEYETIQQSDDYRLHRDVWLAAHPNFGEIERKSVELFASKAERHGLGLKTAELEQAILTDYLRRTHAQRSSGVMLALGSADPHLSVAGINLAPFAARLCSSHTQPVSDVTPVNGFQYDERIGPYSVNMAYLALVLRLADVLDFDRERAPDVLYRTIHFADEVSLHEWEKTRSVEGWEITSGTVRFTARCTHPVYEKAVRQYMDMIDNELVDCLAVVDAQPGRCSQYHLSLPARVLRDRIGPKDNTYRYHDLSFHLERDEVVALLMTENLYSGPHLCVRELVQNSLDALRYRRALLRWSGGDLQDGRITLTHELDADGYEVLECRDNGVGMDEEVIVKYFANVGKSFYRSPEFEAELARLGTRGLRFDPCSRFGIGFMSCFMVGDRIRVTTRKDYGSARGWGTPLEVEINGLGGLIVVRTGRATQEPGTIVRVVSRRRPFIPDKWADEVRLTSVLRGFMLATEFPIEGECRVPGIEDRVSIPTTLQPPATFLERHAVTQIWSAGQDMGDIAGDLRGTVRESFLVSADGLPCLSNDEASWVARVTAHDRAWCLRRAGQEEDVRLETLSSTQICVDGILVGGPPGRPSDDVELMLGWCNPGIYATSSVLVDARGPMKPELSPARFVPERWLHGGRSTAGWHRLEAAVYEARGRVWEKLCARIDDAMPRDLVWRLSEIYGAQVYDMRSTKILASLAIPLLSDAGECRWCRLQGAGPFVMRSLSERGQFELADLSGRRVALPQDLRTWEESGSRYPSLVWHMNATALLVSRAELDRDQIVFRPSVPDDPGDTPCKRIVRSFAGPVSHFLLPYAGELREAVVIGGPFATANSNHPLVRLGHSSRFSNDLRSVEEFAQAITRCLCLMARSGPGEALERDIGRAQKWTGHLYSGVDWERFDDALKPPYRYWGNKGWMSVDAHDLMQWRNA